MEFQEFILREKQRGDCYKFLAAFFYRPNDEFLMEGLAGENLSRSLQAVCPEAAAFSLKMQEALERFRPEELLVDYARLFVGPYALKAPPYGSIYLDKEKLVMGPSTMEVKHFYHQAGLDLAEDFKEPPDHIAVELEFMYYLIFKEVEASEKSESDTALHFLKTQELFLNRFLAPWVPSFGQKIKENTENDFYPSLADCLITFIDRAPMPPSRPEFLRKRNGRGDLDGQTPSIR